MAASAAAPPAAAAAAASLRGLRFVGRPIDRAATHGPRRDPEALSRLLRAPSARFLLVRLAPREEPSVLAGASEPPSLAWWTREELLGLAAEADKEAIYLGPILEGGPSSPSSAGSNGAAPVEAFAVDVGGFLAPEASASLPEGREPGLRWRGGRELALWSGCSDAEVSIAGLALALASWNAQARFHPSTGRATAPVEGGVKRQEIGGSAKVYPRTDPVAIGMIVSPDGERALLHKRKNAAGPYKSLYTCISGFVDQCESVEDALRREAREEAGIEELSKVDLVASQGWPLGRSGSCELMIGCRATAASERLEVNFDEVGDARWFSRAEVRSMLARKHPDGLVVPPASALAYHLIRQWVDEAPSAGPSAAFGGSAFAATAAAAAAAAAGIIGLAAGLSIGARWGGASARL